MTVVNGHHIETSIPQRVTCDEPSLMIGLVLRQMRDRPRSIAVRYESRSMNYGALFDASRRLATALQVQGIGANDVIGLAMGREPLTVALILATLQSGAAVLPLDMGYPLIRLTAMLEDSRPALIVGNEDSRRHLLPDIPWRSPAMLDSTSADPAALKNGSLAYVLFTSGSTGRPKGVAMSSIAVARLISWHIVHPRLGRAARTLQFAPLSFDVSFQEILSTFATGGTLVLPTEVERRNPFALLMLIARERIERIFLPYVALHALAEAVAAGASAPTTLRDVITAGEQLRLTPSIRALFAALPGCTLHNHYGPTETHVVTAFELSGNPAEWPELPPIGSPLPHVRVRLVDAELNRVATGCEGELLLGGDCLAAGYIHRPDLTAERFVELNGERWYRTGDIVRELGSGILAYIGRQDEQIKVDGYRIEPSEIENVLCRHEAVLQAVVASADSSGPRRLIAHVVPRGSQIDDVALVAELRAHCEAILASYLVPKSFVVHAALPLTASGKIDRLALAGREVEAPWIWPDGAPIQQQLAALWKQLLHLDDLDINANLFALGATSLTVVRALTELRRRGFRALSAALIFEHPSVVKQAALFVTPPASLAASEARKRSERQRVALSRFDPRKAAL